MKTVYKYNLTPICEYQELFLPAGSVILSVHSQGDYLCLWALVDTEEELEESVKLWVYGTGNYIDEDLIPNLEFIGTCLMFNGSLVYHVFKQN